MNFHTKLPFFLFILVYFFPSLLRSALVKAWQQPKSSRGDYATSSIRPSAEAQELKSLSFRSGFSKNGVQSSLITTENVQSSDFVWLNLCMSFRS